MKPKTRSLRVSDDVFNELMRLRNPLFGIGKQKSWDELFSLMLIFWHGNSDWKEKVQLVDLSNGLKKELGALQVEFTNGKIDKNEFYERASKIESKYYADFAKKQAEELNK